MVTNFYLTLKSNLRNLQLNQTYGTELQTVQNFAARIVLGLKKFDHISEGRTSLKWLNVSEILFNDLVLVFKYVNGLEPSYLVDYIITRSETHNRNLRRSGDFHAAGCQ